MKYKFLGQPDRNFSNLVHGKIYRLVVKTVFRNGKPMITEPFHCPYSNWEAFYKNWEPITRQKEKELFMEEVNWHIHCAVKKDFLCEDKAMEMTDKEKIDYFNRAE